MSITNNIGMLLLSVYLIVVGVTQVASGVSIPPIIPGLLGIAAGVFILLKR